MRISDWSSDVCSSDLLARDHRTVMTGVAGDLTHERRQRFANDVDAAGLVVVDALEPFDRPRGIEQRGATTGDDAFLDRGAGRVKRVVDAILAFLALDFGRAADLDHGPTAGELVETLLELLATVFAGGVLDLGPDRFGPALDRVGITGAIDERGVVL